jgi:hypothetical protein
MPALLSFLIAALIAYVVWWVIGLFIKGVSHTIIGFIIGLMLLVYGLRLFGVAL